jgi:hypothetical protein
MVLAAACGGLGLMLNILVPPAAFDCKFSGALSVIEAPVGEVHARCGGVPGAPKRIFACAIPLMMGACLIILPKVEPGGVTKAQQDRLRRHEDGHCWGWGADHAGWRR